VLFDEEIPDTSMLSPDRCCLCNEPAIEIGLFGYPWCERCYMRCFVLQWASENGYPDLSYDTGKIKYGSGEGLLSWLAVAIIGTDDYVWSMLLAIGQYQHKQEEKVEVSIAPFGLPHN
jgi:hypothetical protein